MAAPRRASVPLTRLNRLDLFLLFKSGLHHQLYGIKSMAPPRRASVPLTRLNRLDLFFAVQVGVDSPTLSKKKNGPTPT